MRSPSKPVTENNTHPQHVSTSIADMMRRHERQMYQGSQAHPQRPEAGKRFAAALASGPPAHTERKLKKKYGVLHVEDAPTNAAGGGAIAGIGVGRDGEPGGIPNKYKKKTSLLSRKLPSLLNFKAFRMRRSNKT
jgi:hypothetical protein